MRDGTGTLGTCLAEVPPGDSAKRPCGLRTQESPRPPGIPSWAKQPAGDVHGNLQKETLSLEMKSDPSEAWLHSGTKALACLKESLRRNSASPAARGQTVDLFFAPAEDCFAGVSCGVEAALVRDWLGGGPRATNSHRGPCCRGEPGGEGLPCDLRSGTGISAGTPRALLEGRGSGWHSVLSTARPARPEVLPAMAARFPGSQSPHCPSRQSKPRTPVDLPGRRHLGWAGF
ncbi:PREDICTED: protein FAM220A [Myotis davidii]|uniref:protein FAM220A n=1 Tax=Myotis davidii TaxID=225400 RepID=UPI0007678609|nr:PREDICTED: protein FAM220A [Myotis davidii]